MPHPTSQRLRFCLKTTEDLQAEFSAMKPEDRAEVSDEWLALVANAPAANPWIHGFRIERRSDGSEVGACGFKGPPVDGTVEVAYGIAPDQQGKGYATEAAAALVVFAFEHDDVTCVRAHTLPEVNASGSVLTKCGLKKVGEVVDPDDGLVWRWEKYRDES